MDSWPDTCLSQGFGGCGLLVEAGPAERKSIKERGPVAGLGEWGEGFKGSHLLTHSAWYQPIVYWSMGTVPLCTIWLIQLTVYCSWYFCYPPWALQCRRGQPKNWIKKINSWWLFGLIGEMWRSRKNRGDGGTTHFGFFSPQVLPSNFSDGKVGKLG